MSSGDNVTEDDIAVIAIKKEKLYPLSPPVSTVSGCVRRSRCKLYGCPGLPISYHSTLSGPIGCFLDANLVSQESPLLNS